jgi:hypothetical protein
MTELDDEGWTEIDGDQDDEESLEDIIRAANESDKDLQRN